VVHKMAHAPARLFHIKDRGFIRAGCKADLVLVDMNAPWTVDATNIRYKCGWSPFEGQRFRARVCSTWVNGRRVFDGDRVDTTARGERLTFDR